MVWPVAFECKPPFADLTQDKNPFPAFVDMVAVTLYGVVTGVELLKTPKGRACPVAPPLKAKLNEAETVAVTEICSLFVPLVMAVA